MNIDPTDKLIISFMIKALRNPQIAEQCALMEEFIQLVRYIQDKYKDQGGVTAICKHFDLS